jgi:hypothetical protein
MRVFPKTQTPATRFQLIADLCNPRDEEGRPLPPLISPEQAIALLDCPDTWKEPEWSQPESCTRLRLAR